MRAKQTCAHCGTRQAEWLESQGGRRDAYTAVLDRCPGCEQLEFFRKQTDLDKAGKGVYVRLAPRG